MKLRAREGLTAMELMVVIAVLLILSVGIYMYLGSLRNKSKVARTIEDIQSLRTVWAAFESDTGFFPADGNIEVLYDKNQFTDANYSGCDPDKWQGPYLPAPKGDVTLKPPNQFGGVYDAFYQDIDGDGYTDYGVKITNVPRKLAEQIDTKLDGQADGTKGYVRYDDSKARTDVYVIFGSE